MLKRRPLLAFLISSACSLAGMADPALSQDTPAKPASAQTEQETAPAPTGGQLLEQAYDNYRKSPDPATFAEMSRLLKQYLSQAGGKIAPAALIKANKVLSAVGARAIDAGTGRVWIFSRLPDFHEALVQWADSKSTVTYRGKRRRIKHVITTTVWRSATLTLPPTVALQAARVLGGEGTHSIVLAGSDHGSGLWFKMYKQTGEGWQETASRFDSIPAFLTSNVSGKVSFRGSDMILNIGRVVPQKFDTGAAHTLPEAESGTYRFWLKYSDEGYALQSQLPDESQFQTVRALLDALSSSRTDVAKSLLGDARLLSIPKYVGLRGPSSAFKVVQMASPPSGATRFRLVTASKNDLIFEVAKIKDRQVVRAIFIAPPDPFLQEIASRLVPYDKVATASAAAPDSADKH